jgi:hypothetical protein
MKRRANSQLNGKAPAEIALSCAYDHPGRALQALAPGDLQVSQHKAFEANSKRAFAKLSVILKDKTTLKSNQSLLIQITRKLKVEIEEATREKGRRAKQTKKKAL